MHSSTISRTTGRNESASPQGRSHSLFATASRPHVRLLERDAHTLHVLATRGEVATIRRGDWHAGLSALHQTVGAELRQFVAVATKPVAGTVMPFVLETRRDAVIVERPRGLAEHLVQFPFPYSSQERHDRIVTNNEQVAVAPDGVLGTPVRPWRGHGVLP